MAAEATEATESLPKEAGLVGLDGPLDQLDLTKMLAESIEPQEQDRSEETSPSGDAVEEAEPVEESTDGDMNYAGYILKNDFFDKADVMDFGNGPCWFLDASHLNEGLIPISNE